MTLTVPARWPLTARLSFAAVLCLLGCRPEPETPPRGPSAPGPDAPHEQAASLRFLLSSSAGDFRAHTPGPLEVRHVRFGLRDTTAGQQSYVLCGDFRHRSGGDTAQWTPFATVEGTQYEQWLGETRYCQTIAGAWNTSDSLTALLQKRLP